MSSLLLRRFAIRPVGLGAKLVGKEILLRILIQGDCLRSFSHRCRRSPADSHLARQLSSRALLSQIWFRRALQRRCPRAQEPARARPVWRPPDPLATDETHHGFGVRDGGLSNLGGVLPWRSAREHRHLVYPRQSVLLHVPDGLVTLHDAHHGGRCRCVTVLVRS